MKSEKELRTMLQNKIRKRALCISRWAERDFAIEIQLLRCILEEDDIYLEPTELGEIR